MINIEHIEERLAATGFSANAASQLAGFGRDYVRDILRGKIKDPSHSRLLRLAEVLRCSTEYLSGDSDEVGSIPFIQRVSSTILIPVTNKLRPGYFEEGATEIIEPFDWHVGTMGLVNFHEWLEFVESPPSWGIELPTECLIHIVGARDGLREGRTVLCVQKHPTAELFRRGVFKVHILEPDEDDYVELQDGGRARAAGRRESWTHAASSFVTGENDLGIQVLGEVAAIYQYLDEGKLQQLRDKSRSRG